MFTVFEELAIPLHYTLPLQDIIKRNFKPITISQAQYKDLLWFNEREAGSMFRTIPSRRKNDYFVGHVSFRDEMRHSREMVIDSGKSENSPNGG